MKNEGRCIYCGKKYTGQGIGRHLATHLKAMGPESRSRSYLLTVKANPYFLCLLMDGDATLYQLDDFLRRIWLECCGHMSQFSFGRWSDELSLATKAQRVFDKGVELWYAYDFGSTTELMIKCLDAYPFSTKKEGGIKLLSRNEPFDIICDRCKKRSATQLCTVHYYEGEERFFCEECAEVHEEECEEAEYAMMPIVNSPRMGVCAYTGGTIDLERDTQVQD